MAYQCAFCNYIIYTNVCARCGRDNPEHLLKMQESERSEYHLQKCPAIHDGKQCEKLVGHSGKCLGDGVYWLTEWKIVYWVNGLGRVESGRFLSEAAGFAQIQFRSHTKLRIAVDKIQND